MLPCPFRLNRRHASDSALTIGAKSDLHPLSPNLSVAALQGAANHSN